MGLLQHVKKSEFIRHNAIYFVGSLTIGALNYLYYPVVGRLLQPSAFGEVQTLVSLFLQIGIFMTVLGMLTINIITNYQSSQQRNRVITELEKLSLLIGIVFFAAATLGRSWLQQYFQFQSSWPFVVLALAIVVTIPYAFRSGYLVGKKLFGLNAWAGISGAGSKLIFSFILVAVGLGTTGALAGILVAQALMFTVTGYFALRHGFHESFRLSVRPPDMQLIRPELKYAGLVLLGSLAITIMYSIDIVVVKHYFDAHTAGLYAGVATAARIIFFLTASVAQVLMPSIKLSQPPAKNRQVLKRSFGLVTLIGGATLAIFYMAPEFIVSVLMGSTYSVYASLLPRLSIAVFVISLLNLLMAYCLALRRYGAGIVAILGVVLTYGLMLAHHQSLEAVVSSLLYGSLAVGVAFALWLMWTENKSSLTERGYK
ncbi:MAG TPA: oligosaccharide flippase family protein [Verrucomicrobiae bacterium]|nr:oligosaccharide flippase family protein [Verrucomicrobiae bacterium]